ncbi:uncharacterized protein BO87DRAFT_3511 [Aspergillus neoniger CBS 115656]|uniref:Uncharacterized protein n=1 Tax=Aspergillus neoniger (strain CBS 115656) TaxID=1448310 RepID=A0A318YY66_ASPNB|nr:hypothetical protein BO87DRAFT_3511 [Aspergillus neoniger CBS 115656]PYH39606.1 hypothetical protein BO87DRAFT_3511 [Aspergillus neoniger CBS 115656]
MHHPSMRCTWCLVKPAVLTCSACIHRRLGISPSPLSLPLSPLSSLPSHTVITRTDDWFSVLLTSTSLSIYLLDGCEPYKSCLFISMLFFYSMWYRCTSSHFITGCVQKIGTFFDACSSALLVPSLMATSITFPLFVDKSTSYPRLEFHESLQTNIAARLAFIYLK